MENQAEKEEISSSTKIKEEKNSHSTPNKTEENSDSTPAQQTENFSATSTKQEEKSDADEESDNWESKILRYAQEFYPEMFESESSEEDTDFSGLQTFKIINNKNYLFAKHNLRQFLKIYYSGVYDEVQYKTAWPQRFQKPGYFKLSAPYY